MDLIYFFEIPFLVGPAVVRVLRYIRPIRLAQTLYIQPALFPAVL